MKKHPTRFHGQQPPSRRTALGALALLTVSAASLLADGLKVEVQGPEFREKLVNYRLVFQNSAPGEAIQQAETNWPHRLADRLHELPQNAAFANPFSVMLQWELEIDPEGGVATGWYLERGEQTLYIRPGLFGADTWETGDELVLTVGVPLSEATQDVDLLASAVRAEHEAASGSGSYSSATRPALQSAPAREGAPPEAIPMQSSPGQLLLRWQSRAGHAYLLERSHDLVGWEIVGQAQEGDDYPLQQIVPATDDRSVFYRLRISVE